MRRADNQDNLYADGVSLPQDLKNRPFSFDAAGNAPVLLAVCDGLGGEEKGEVASSLVVDRLLQSNYTLKSASCNKIKSTVEQFIASANRDVISTGKRCGTTIALAAVTAGGTYCCNIGDSRIYCLFGKKLKRITNDHTSGFQASGDGASYDRRNGGNKLTRCIGIGEQCLIEDYPLIQRRCRMLICSDGLTDMVSDSEIEAILKGSRTPGDASDALVKAALGGGGADNISVIVADIPRCGLEKRIAYFLRKLRLSR
ncbi:MAG: PP2C family protein-serine/threonine phosphatase [Ruminiclostridium sp.]